jgi:hypothetical protein
VMWRPEMLPKVRNGLTYEERVNREERVNQEERVNHFLLQCQRIILYR